MSGYVVSPDADGDILEIWRYLFQRGGIEVADRVESELYAAFEALARNPGQSHRRSDLTSHRVLHAKRDVQRILGQ